MKKLFFFLTVLLFAAVLPAETLYYYSDGRKIELTEDFSSYSFIRTSKTRADFKLPADVKLIKKHENISIIEAPSESTLKTLQKSGNLFPSYRKKEGGTVYVSNQIFVKIPGKPNTGNAEKWCEKHGMKLIKQYKYVPEWYLVSVEENPIKKAAALVDSKTATQAEPDFFIHLQKRAYIPNDSLFKNQWHLHNDGTNSQLTGSDHAHVAEAWEVLQAFKGNIGGKGVKLAVIDDGFDLDHEDLNGQFLSGYDFRGKDNDPSYENDSRYPDYSDMHGTCCAGVAAAKADNSKGVVGACPNCKLIPVRIDLSSSYVSLSSIGLDAFEWAADAGADIMSNSWGPADGYGAEDMTQTLKDLVANLAATGRNGKGILIFFAAGNGDESIDNSRTKDGFAGNPNVFAIGATRADGKRCIYSDYGPSLDFMVPSSDYNSNYTRQYDGIWTVDNTGRDGYNTGDASLGDYQGNYTNDFSGTSSACPLAAGITGLVLSANPNLTRDEVYQIYIETSEKVGGVTYDISGFNEKYGYGRINACEAVKKALDMAGKDVSSVTCGGSIVNPDPIDDPDTDTTDTTDTSDTSDTSDTTDTTDTADSTDTTDTSDTSDTTDTADTTDTTDSTDTTDTGDTTDTSDTTDTTDTDDKENCGNGFLDDGEQCDDGNRMDGDGCSKYCMKEEEQPKKLKSNGGCSLDLL